MARVHRIRRTLYLIWGIIIVIAILMTSKFMKIFLENEYNNVIAQSNSSIIKYIDESDKGYSILTKQTFGKLNILSYINKMNIIPNKMVIGATSLQNNVHINSHPYWEVDFNKNSTYYNKYHQNFFTKKYFLSNGNLNADMNNNVLFYPKDKTGITTQKPNENNELEINFLHGDLFIENDEKNTDIDKVDAIATLKSFDGVKFTREQLNDFNFLIRNFYIVDETTVATEKLFDAKILLGKNMKMVGSNKKPQVLIYHTHSQEAYIDSKKGKVNDTVVGVGKVLKKLLEEEYGYNVIHDTTSYDMGNGYLDRNKAYNFAEKGVRKILEENPSIEVVIDLHRDAKTKRSTYINGKECAQIMLFNGLSRDLKGPIAYLDNPNLSDNLAFSLQLQLKSLEKYPGLFYKNYLKYLRFNLHLRPKSILVELGTENNTIESAKNSMEPLAEILNDVLQGK